MRTCARCGKEMRARLLGPHMSGHTRQDRQRYIYDDATDPQHKHPLEHKLCPGCGTDVLARKGNRGFCSPSCSQQGERNSAWRGEVPSYHGAHQRTVSERGKASEYPCEHCGVSAQQWAFDHETPAERRLYEEAGKQSEGMVYSFDSCDYIPLCVPCHKTYDLAVAV